jgi:hypothetical protein
MVNAFNVQLTLEGLDGSVQIEPASATDNITTTKYCTFTSTNNNFCVAKTDSYITDIMVVDGAGGAPTAATRLALFVNGRDTGISYIIAGLESTVNNRMPSKPGIGEGASIQIIQL